jgi:hypothetical protein
MRRRRAQMTAGAAQLLRMGLLMLGCVGVAYAQQAQPLHDTAQAASSLIDRARLLESERRWNEAAATLREALTMELAPTDREDAYRHLAAIATAQYHVQRLQNSLGAALSPQTLPASALPDRSLSRLFDAGRGFTQMDGLMAPAALSIDEPPLYSRAAPDRDGPQILIVVVGESEVGEAPKIIAEVLDASPVDRVELSYAGAGADAATILMRNESGARWTASIPADATAVAGKLNFWIAATDAWGNAAVERSTVSVRKSGRGTFKYLIGAAGVGVAALAVGLLRGATGGDDAGGLPVFAAAPLPPQ